MAEGAPLLREYTLIAYRGFESLLLRHPNKRRPSGAFFVWDFEYGVRTVGSIKRDRRSVLEVINFDTAPQG